MAIPMKDELIDLLHQRFSGHELEAPVGAWENISGQLAGGASGETLREALQDKFRGHEVNVDPGTWAQISSRLGHAVASAGSSYTSGLVAAGAAAVIIATALVLWTNKVDAVHQSPTSVEVPVHSMVQPPTLIVEQVIVPQVPKNSPKAVETSTTKAKTQVPAAVEPALQKGQQNGASTKSEPATQPVMKPAAQAQPAVSTKPAPGSVPPSEKPTTQVPKVVVAEKAAVEPSHKAAQDHPTVEAPETDPTTVPSIEAKDDFTILIPNVFTANNDGLNDELQIVADAHSKVEVNIVSAITGNVVFHSNDLNNMWDGLLPNGNIAPEGQYVCVVIFTDLEGQVHRGRMVVQLYR